MSNLGVQIQLAADTNITEEELEGFYSTLEKLSENLCTISKESDVVRQDSVSNNEKSD